MVRALVVACGVRPHYVKAAAFRDTVLARDDRLGEVLFVDVGQHYDQALTGLVTTGLDLRFDATIPHYSRDRAERAGTILAGLSRYLEDLGRARGAKPVVVGFGDALTTGLAGMAAVSAEAPFAHVEAGIRSTADPRQASVENAVRRMLGQVSSLNLCVLPRHRRNLRRESAPGRCLYVGDLSLTPAEVDLLSSAAPPSTSEFVFVHIHKSENMSSEALGAITAAVAGFGRPAMFVVHPAARDILGALDGPASGNIRLVPPMDHMAMLRTLRDARVVLTDSGGVQREAIYAGRRCVVRRNTAGWREFFGARAHVRVGRSREEIASALAEVWRRPTLAVSLRKVLRPSDGARRAFEGLADLSAG
jgi:UDP-N-acetylglucosamine 2-epimerase